MANAIVIPSLLILLSVILKKFIVNRNGTVDVIAEIFLGLPVDLSFVILSIAISSDQLFQEWSDRRSILILGMLVLITFQLGGIYKPYKEYFDEEKYLFCFGLWLLNTIITLSVFAWVLMEVIKE